jgi:DNA-binding transcriptional LysR family regulator
MSSPVKDLNLLRIFEALWLDRNVTKAAKRLNLSQPALSHALSRLRVEMRDEVFVRSGRGMTATPQAEAWAPKVLEALANLDIAFSEAEAFSPLKAQGRITIVGTDLIEYILLPKLLATLAKEAPDIVVVCRPTDGSFPKAEMERGVIDFAIAGFFVDLPEGFYRQQAGIEVYRSIVRKGHPLVKDKLDFKTFQKLSHILTSPQGDLSGVVDRAMTKRDAVRKVVAGISTFQAIGKIVAETDFCGTLPHAMAVEHARHFNLNIFQPPVDLDPIKFNMIWHQRIHTSPLHRWTRHEIQKILGAAFNS